MNQEEAAKRPRDDEKQQGRFPDDPLLPSCSAWQLTFQRHPDHLRGSGLSLTLHSVLKLAFIGDYMYACERCLMARTITFGDRRLPSME